MSYRGDFALGSTFNLKFTTIDAGIPTSVSGAFVAAYPDNSVTEITAGLVFSSDFDSRVGLNGIQVVATSGNGYVTGSNYDIVVISGTVGGKSLVGYVVGSFSIQARFAPAGSSSDPLATFVPGSYVPGQAGYVLASRMPTGTVLVGDKTGFSLSSPQVFNLNGNISGTITNVLNVINPVTAGNVTGTVVLSSVEHNNIADAFLKRDWTAITGEASRSVLNALRKLRNKVSFNGTTTLTVTKEDDTASAFTQAVTTDSAQNPFKEVG